MNWLFDLHITHPVAHAIGALALVCTAGMALGSVKVRGIGLGTAGVLFAGILAGHFGKPVDHETLDFVKEFGLILFVFTIGLQLGPGFFAALRREGLRLNLLAGAVVLAGVLLAVGIGWLLRLDFAAVLGLLAGATTNTPSLGAAQQTLATLPGVTPDRLALPALAYAVTYPAAIAGIIGTLLLLKRLYRIDPAQEAREFIAQQRGRVEPLETRTLVVQNPNLAGVTLDEIPSRAETGVTISRHRRSGETEVRAATGDTVLQPGDAITAIGLRAMLDRFQRVVGQRSDEDLRAAPGKVAYRRVVVTHKDVLGKSVRELGLDARFGVVVSRVTRADFEMTAVPALRLQFGDMLQVVGGEEGLERTAALLGNSVKELNETHFIPLFIGILAGIIVGTLPIAFPGLPQPVRLGLAGGPLIVALVLGRIGRIGRIVCHMPVNSNLAFREFGIALFFAAVGLAAGPKFFASVFSADGLRWLGAGLCVTVPPLLLAGIFARSVLKMNFTVLSGLLAGSVTDPPALAFANNLAKSDAPTVAYATVYPLTTLLRILSAQILALLLIR
ncbi:MAG: putative transporter [Limisphaerales bacterium]